MFHFSTRLFHTCHTYRHHLFSLFLPLSMTLTGGHKVNAKLNLLASFSPTLFSWSGWNLMWWSSSYWTSGDYFLEDLSKQEKQLLFYRQRQQTFTWQAFGCLWMDLNQTWCDDRCYCTLHFDSSLIGLDLDWRLRECEKAKNSWTIGWQCFQLIWMEFGLLRLVDVMNLMFHFVFSIR